MKVGRYDVEPVTAARAADAERAFAATPASEGCFCAWFIIPVTEYHAGGRAGNRAMFLEMLQTEPAPLGLVAYDGDEPVGWCAAGPRSRFVRALRVPSFKGRDPSEDDSVWLVPCFSVPAEHRRKGVSSALLAGAVELASAHGALAIEGFPFAAGAKLGRESMVGVEAAFAACGFEVARRPSNTRVVMRRELTG